MVDVDSGPITADQRFSEVPKDKWDLLMWTKRDFISVNINYDCRELVQFLRDAEEAYESLGFESADHMIMEGYELKPDDIRMAVEWLERNQPDEAIGIDKVRQHHDWKARNESGESLRSIARDEGVSDMTVARRVQHKPVMTEKRCRVTYQISQYTKPETAAKKIRATFGDDFAEALRAEL